MKPITYKHFSHQLTLNISGMSLGDRENSAKPILSLHVFVSVLLRFS